MATILVTGGAGYVGSVLVPKLVEKGHIVHVLDTFWYWDSPADFIEKLGLTGNEKVKAFKGDIRVETDLKKSLEGCDTVIAMACMSNDPSADLNAEVTESINNRGNVLTIRTAKATGVKRFIYVSTSSVYGIKDAPNVTEDMELDPLTQYSRLKAEIEKVLLEEIDEQFRGVIIRSATVCGYSPRTRLDVVVNLLTGLAVKKGRIKVFGGTQLRPNIHIQDITDLYCELVDIPIEEINGKVFNAGTDNMKVMEIAKAVQEGVGDVDIEMAQTDDLRSYHISSAKIKEELGWEPKRTVKDAVREIAAAFKDGRLGEYDNTLYHNIKRMKELQIA